MLGGCSSNGTELTDEQKQLRCQGLFDEFLQNVDVNEAVLCAQELATPGEQHLPEQVNNCV